MGIEAVVGIVAPRAWDAIARLVTGKRQRRQVLQSLLRDVTHDRDALNAFLYHVQLGDESEHVISDSAGLDIWYDDLLATRPLPDLLADREADAVHQMRHSFPPTRDVDAALRTLLLRYKRLPLLQQALHEEFKQGEGQALWQGYLAWEEADKRHGRSLSPHPEETMRLWEMRQQLGNRWYAFKTASSVEQEREACRCGVVEAREQCEVIMGMLTAELPLRPIAALRPDTRGLV